MNLLGYGFWHKDDFKQSTEPPNLVIMHQLLPMSLALYDICYNVKRIMEKN